MQHTSAEGLDFYHYTDPLRRDCSIILEGDQMIAVRDSLFGSPQQCDDTNIRLAVLGDLHGHLTDAYTYLEAWLKLSGRPIDAILQVGDIGALDDISHIDQVTREIAEKDQQELAFRDYYNGSPEADRFLGPEGVFRGIPLIFIDGNHDDIDLLRYRNFDPHYPELSYLESGSALTLSKGKRNVEVGSIGWEHTHGQLRRYHELDVLLTHSKLEGSHRNMDKPKYHFFGHSHEEAPGFSDRATNSYGLNMLKKLSEDVYRPGSMGVLELGPESFFYYVPDDLRIDPSFE